MAHEEDSIAPSAGPQAHFWDYLAVVLRRRNAVIAVFLVVLAAATLRTLLTRPVYRGTAQVLIDHEGPDVLSFKEVTTVDAGRDPTDYYQTQYKLLQSRALARRVIEGLNLMQDPEFGGPRPTADVQAALATAPGESQLLEGIIDQLLLRLVVVPIKNSRLVTVSFDAYRPELAAEVANKATQMYIQQTLEQRYQTSSDAVQWLGGQIDDQRKKVDAQLRGLEALKTRQGLTSIDERRTLLDQKLKDLGTALTGLSATRLEKSALYQHMTSTASPEELPEVRNSPLMQSLRNEMAELERTQAQLSQRYLEQHPEVVKIKNQIEETRNRMRLEARDVISAAQNDYKSAAAQEANVSRELDATKAEMQALAVRAADYDAAKRDLDAGNQVLASLIDREKQTDVAQELKSSNIRVVDAARVPSSPVRPNRILDILIGIVLGGISGVGLAFVLEYLDNTIKNPDDVRRHLQLPLLGVVAEGTAGQTVHSPGAPQAFTECYRMIRTSLAYSWPEQAEATSRVLVLTSTAPGEGKTLTAVNLALTLAAIDGRVLLIDADLRKPTSHTILRVSRAPGLSDILVGKATPSTAIQRLPGTALSFLSCGRVAPSPADLMTTATLRALIDGLRQYYSWIVIDTPPVAAVAESQILAPLGDGVLIVCGAEMVPARAVVHTVERVQETGARVLGAILNRAQLHKHSYYYRQYYGHYYGQYYATETEDAPAETVARARGKRARG